MRVMGAAVKGVVEGGPRDLWAPFPRDPGLHSHEGCLTCRSKGSTTTLMCRARRVVITTRLLLRLLYIALDLQVVEWQRASEDGNKAFGERLV